MTQAQTDITPTVHRSNRFIDFAERFGLLFAWLAVILIFWALNGSTFLSTANFLNILNSQSILVLLTLTLLPTLIVGELDLSFAFLMGLSAVAVGFFNARMGWPIGMAILAALAIGLVVGLVNAILIVKWSIDSIVVTLGTGSVLTGIAFALSSTAIAGIDPAFMAFFGAKYLGLQVGFWIMLAVCFIGWYVLGYTPFGRYLYFIGAGRDAARLAGIPVERISFLTLVVSALMAAMTGVLLVALQGAADPTVGGSYFIPAFSAAFLGYTAVVPGRFNVWGTFIAVYFLVTGITGLQIFGLSGWVEQVFYGAALLVAVMLGRLVRSMRANAS